MGKRNDVQQEPKGWTDSTGAVSAEEIQAPPDAGPAPASSEQASGARAVGSETAHTAQEGGGGLVRIRRVAVEGREPITSMSVLKTVRNEQPTTVLRTSAGAQLPRKRRRPRRPRMAYVGVSFPLRQEEHLVDVETAVAAVATGLFEVHPESAVQLKAAPAQQIEEVSDVAGE